jgi:uncharacterized membrane protein YdjX (TVP38/TMEM64 family)
MCVLLQVLNKRLLFLLALILIGIFFSAIGAWDNINEQWVDRHIRNQGLIGILAYVGFCSLFTASGVPRQLAAFLGGYAFGFTIGVLLATFAATLGCIITFYLAKLIARPIIKKRYLDKIQSIHQFLDNRTFTMTIIIRLLPFGSNLITNMVAGVAQINNRQFFIGSFIGYLPQMIIFALVGSGIEVMSVWKIALSIVLLIVSSILSGYLYKEYKLEQSRMNAL